MAQLVLQLRDNRRGALVIVRAASTKLAATNRRLGVRNFASPTCCTLGGVAFICCPARVTTQCAAARRRTIKG